MADINSAHLVVPSGTITIGSSTAALDSYVNTRGYITSTPGSVLTMNSTNISFTNDGAGLTWGNNNSRIYDDLHLNIATNDYLCIKAPTQPSVTATDSYFSGNLYLVEGLVASQTWVNNIFLTTNLTQLTVERLIGNPIVSYTTTTCFIHCLLTTGNNWIQFGAYNTVTDA